MSTVTRVRTYAATLTTLSIVLALACASEERAPVSIKSDGPDAAGGAGNRGGASTGGSGAQGGTVPVAPNCDLGALGCEPATLLGVELPACCLTETACGLDMTAVAAPSMGLIPGGCVDPATIPTGPRVLDGGIVPVEGGDDIQLDANCPGIDIDSPLGPLSLPGCCTPGNFCGGSTHEFALATPGQQAPPPACVRNDELASQLGGGDSGFDLTQILTIPEDPNQACTYRLGEASDAGAFDGGSPTDQDASVALPDASVDATSPSVDATSPGVDAAASDAATD